MSTCWSANYYTRSATPLRAGNPSLPKTMWNSLSGWDRMSCCATSTGVPIIFSRKPRTGPATMWMAPSKHQPTWRTWNRPRQGGPSVRQTRRLRAWLHLSGLRCVAGNLHQRRHARSRNPRPAGPARAGLRKSPHRTPLGASYLGQREYSNAARPDWRGN